MRIWNRIADTTRTRGHGTAAAYLALFLALTGGAALALEGKNSVFSDDIKDGQVKGSDVKESSLNEVPKAKDAAKLGGTPAGAYVTGGARVVTAFAEQPENTPQGTMLELPGIGAIRGGCSASGDVIGLDFLNSSGQLLRAWIDNGQEDPARADVVQTAGGAVDSTGDLTADDADMFTFQVSSITGSDHVKVATVFVSTHEDPGVDGNCSYALQGTVFPRG